MALRTAVKPPAPAGVNFGELSFYVAGGGFPEGDYALEFNIEMFQAVNASGVSNGPPRLGVQITAHSLTDTTAEPRKQFYSMGGNADKSFAPNPDTGKGLVVIPGAAGSNLNNQSNWAFFLRNLYDSGLPEGIFANDLSVLDGVHVHIQNVPEPEERKGFGNKTGETAGEVRKNNTIAVVSEIKEDGKPWEGTGGIPEIGSTPAVKKGPVPVAKPVAAKPVAARVVAKPVAVEVDDLDIRTAALAAISSVLEKPENANSCPKLKLRTGSFKYLQGTQGDDMAGAVVEEFFQPGKEAQLGSILAEIGYGVNGAAIVPA